MQLRNARLCLDCEEVHEGEQCPVCASETFAWLTRWVPAPERRAPAAPAAAPPSEALDTYRQMLMPEKRSAMGRMVRGGAVGLALFGVAGLMWRQKNRNGERSAEAPEVDSTTTPTLDSEGGAPSV